MKKNMLNICTNNLLKLNKLKKNSKQMLNNKIVLVTGGTGSFGNEFVKYLLKKL